ncbi:MAG: nucleoside deaminase [Clostridia bacterium]|jgi:tRNA(adenine34) deaminase|nr:nucleoside deaminase [Clostridia bacterium]
MEENFDLQQKYMRSALAQAKIAYKKAEVPIGCVIVLNGKIIARTHNRREELNQAYAHAEILAIKKACTILKSWRLNNCDIYVTVEPCPMCAGAIVNARMRNIYFGAINLKGGSCGTVYNIPSDNVLNHTCNIFGGLLKEECGKLITAYFKDKRIE